MAVRAQRSDCVKTRKRDDISLMISDNDIVFIDDKLKLSRNVMSREQLKSSF